MQQRMTRDDAIAILRAHESELKAAGVRSLRIFGSVARNEAGPDSDIEVEAAFENAFQLTLLDLVCVPEITRQNGSRCNLRN